MKLGLLHSTDLILSIVEPERVNIYMNTPGQEEYI